MKPYRKIATFAILPFVGLLGTASTVFAHDDDAHGYYYRNNGVYKSPHQRAHDYLGAEHRTEHESLEAQHEAARQYPMTRHQHRALHKALKREHREAHRDLRNQHEDYHGRNYDGGYYRDYGRDYYGDRYSNDWRWR